MSTLNVETDRLERVLGELEKVQADFTQEEQALFAVLMRDGMKPQMPEEARRKAESEAGIDTSSGETLDPSAESARKVAETIMAFRDGMTDDEDKRLVDSIVVAAAAPEDDDEVAGHGWVHKWSIGAPTSGSVYTFYRNMCTNSGFGRSTYLQANFGTFWTTYRCYVWY